MKKGAKIVRRCHGVGVYAEGLYLISNEAGKGKVEFGTVLCCNKANCFRAVGEPQLAGKPPKGWSATSWRVMLQDHAYAPFNFLLHPSGHLLPETYSPHKPIALEAPVTHAQAHEHAEARADAAEEDQA